MVDERKKERKKESDKRFFGSFDLKGKELPQKLETEELDNPQG